MESTRCRQKIDKINSLAFAPTISMWMLSMERVKISMWHVPLNTEFACVHHHIEILLCFRILLCYSVIVICIGTNLFAYYSFDGRRDDGCRLRLHALHEDNNGCMKAKKDRDRSHLKNKNASSCFVSLAVYSVSERSEDDGDTAFEY